MSNDKTTNRYWADSHEAGGAFAEEIPWRERVRRRKFWDVLRRFTDLVGPEAGDVLELGCAPGRVLRDLHRVAPQHRLHGIDFSAPGIEAARQSLAQHGIEAEMYHGDIRQVDLPPKFDLVVSVGLIEHFEDATDMLRQHARFCKPGGHVAVTVPNFRPWICRRLMQRYDPDVLAAHHLDIMTVAAIEAALAKADLVPVQGGSSGGPRVPYYPTARSGAVRVVSKLLRAWDFGASFLPDGLFWNWIVWGIARVPDDAPRPPAVATPND